jgi:hypothetical protein
VQYEIAANGPVSGGWTWRLSTADISEDVPFSVFPGVARHFCVAEGNGVILTIDGVPTTCLPGSVTRFMGDANVDARLIDGPMRALNLMTMNDVSMTLRVSTSGSTTNDVLAAVAIRDDAGIEIDGELVNLMVLDAVLELDHLPVTVRNGNVALLVANY